MIRGTKANNKMEENAEVLQRVKHPLWAQLHKQNSEELLPNGMCTLLLLPNAQLKSSFILPCPALLFPLSLFFPSPPPLPLSGDCLHARRVAEGAGEVIQSRISPSHPASWYSYHTFTPWGCLPEYQLTEGDFPLSFQLSLSPAHFSALVSPSALRPVCFSFCPFLARSLLCRLSCSLSPPLMRHFFRSGFFHGVRISNFVGADAVSCSGCWDLQRAAWFGRGHRVIFPTACCCLLNGRLSGLSSVCFVCACDSVLQCCTLRLFMHELMVRLCVTRESAELRMLCSAFRTSAESDTAPTHP